VGFPECLLQLVDSFFQSGLPGSIGLEAVLYILLLPVVQESGGNAVSPAELGCGTDSAQVFFNNLTFELGTERPLLSHDKILSAPGAKDPVRHSNIIV